VNCDSGPYAGPITGRIADGEILEGVDEDCGHAEIAMDGANL
jgi:hypothetical protein